MADLKPITRVEHLLARIAGDPATVLTPISRIEFFLQRIIDSGGTGPGGEVTPASVALAIRGMTDAQAAQALADLGYKIDSVIDGNSGNPVTNSALALDLESKEDAHIVVEIDSSITTPTITPEDNHIYNCGELASLTINNPPAQGAYSIVFTSGSTATVTTIPTTILGLEDFAPEANTLYELNVLDNRAVVGSWAVSA